MGLFGGGEFGPHGGVEEVLIIPVSSCWVGEWYLSKSYM